MLIDEIDITLSGGRGGDGIVSFGKKAKSGPDGGNGGNGGDLYVIAVSDMTALNQYHSDPDRSAENGFPGGKQNKQGKAGKDLEIFVPSGTSLTDIDTNEVFNLDKPGDRLLIAKGGIGGRGNWEFRSARNTTPKNAETGKSGQIRHLHAVLKLVADIGLIGLPNAGKSSLLNELTNAKAKIANYAFTTLSPNLGVAKDKIISDIPGLIEGASEGKGLGFRFLKHIEKVKVLVHCIAADSLSPLKDYETVRKEMEKYNPGLVKKKEIILVTKSDLLLERDKVKFTKLLKPKGVAHFVSIYDEESLEDLSKLLRIS